MSKKKHKNRQKKKKELSKKRMDKKEPEPAMEKPKTLLDRLKHLYVKDYKKLFIIPLLLFLLSAAVLVSSYIQTGDFIKKDVTLKGGISLSVNKVPDNVDGFEDFLVKRFPKSSINFRTIGSADSATGIIIEASDLSEEELLEAVQERMQLDKEDYSVETMGSTL